MKITTHISFFYIKERIEYINRILRETNTYLYVTDIYIHTNTKDLSPSDFVPYSNGSIHIVYHDLTHIDPYKLTWACRELLLQQKDTYDIFMYIEDDIVVPRAAIEYWIAYHKKVVDRGYNLGFVRIETHNNIEYITDLPKKKICEHISIDNTQYAVNNINPYCAFWIYDKEEFHKFISSKYYNIGEIHGYQTREASAFGLHGMNTNWYTSTLIPITDRRLHSGCRIYHIANNYVNRHHMFATIPFQEAYAPK